MGGKGKLELLPVNGRPRKRKDRKVNGRDKGRKGRGANKHFRLSAPYGCK